MNADGYLNIVGRTKDMIIRGGENIYPREIEELLMGHPRIEDAHVLGGPDPKWGEQVCAVIKARAGALMTPQDVRAFLAPVLAHHKIPKYVLVVEEFPLTASGKVQKFRLREEMVKALGRRRPPRRSTPDLAPARNTPAPARLNLAGVLR